MRVTDNMRMRELVTNLGSLQSRHAEVTREASTGLRLQKPSQDPVGAAHVARIQSALRLTQAYRENINIARGDVATTEAALAESTSVMQRARELALQGANDSMNADNRALLAADVRSLKDQLVSLSNAEGSYGYLFAGFKTNQSAFASDGTFQGDGGKRQLEIGTGMSIDASISGAEAFEGQGGGVNVFAQLEALAAALESNDGAAAASSLSGIDQAQEQLIRARAGAGLILNRLDTATESLTQGHLTLTKRQSDVADADMVSTFSELTQLGQTLEQAISVARTTLDMNLSRF